MPQLLILAAIGAGAYFGGKWVRKKARKFAANLERANKAGKTSGPEKRSKMSRKNAQELKKDPKTGIYHIDDE